jgi:signal transduction histidine kinase
LQTIYASGLLLQTAQRSISRKHYENASAYVNHAMEQLDKAVADIRHHIGDLSVKSSGQSLAEGLREVVSSSALGSFTEVDMQLDLPPKMALNSLQVGHLLAIASESISNVIKHAQATAVRITAGLSGNDRLFLEIEDNGVGLPKDMVPGYGLYNMRDRALLLKGTLSVQSTPGKGTTIRVEIPAGGEDETITSVVG